MARETIYENPNVALSGGEGMLTNLLLIPGETYQIVWDGDEYTSTAAEVPFNGMTVVAIGDLGIALGAPTGEYPFLIGALPDGSIGYTFTTESGATSHSIAVYRDAETPVTGETIVLKDRDGNKNYYNPPNGVRFEMGDGNTQLFVNASEVPEPMTLTVAADFTDNKDMVLTPDKGKQFAQVTVTKPIDLTPANIPEGLFIGGVGPGEFKGGGAGGNAKMAFGKITPQSTVQTITHGLGVVPDMIIVTFDTNKQGYSGTIREFIGFSRSFFERNSISGRPSRNLSYYSSAVSHRSVTSTAFMEELGSTSTNYLWGVTDEIFKVPAMDTVHTYFWIAIAGLT